MNPAFLMAISLLGPQASESVPIPVQYDRAYAIDTRIHRSRSTGDADPLTMDEHWRVQVEPTDEGFKTTWRDIEAHDRTEMIVETDARLIPLALTNLDPLWSERGLAMMRFNSNDSSAAEMMFRTVPDNVRQAMLLKDAILISTGQGLDLAVGESVVQRLPGQSIADSPAMAILSTMTLVSVDRETGKAVVTWTTELDPKDVETALPGMMRSLFGLTEEDSAKLEDFNDMLAAAVVSNRRSCRYEIDLPSGLAEQVSCRDIMNLSIGDHHQKTEGRMEATQRLIP